MAQYETLFILPSDSGPVQLKAVQDKLTGIISKTKGAVKIVEDWGIKKLTYPIRKSARGHFVYVNYDASPETLSEITRVFRIDEGVLRFANVRLPDNYDYTAAKKTFMTEAYDDYRNRRPSYPRGDRDGGGAGGADLDGGMGDDDMDFGGDDMGDDAPRGPRRN